MRELKGIIEEIRNNYLQTNEQTLSALSGSLKLVKKMFPRYSSFIMEFIQNADDVGSSKISISLDEEKVVIKNDGRAFNEKDIRSLCSIGESTKSIEDYIGYLGIGFKSIYLISNSVDIHSGGYSFAFKKDKWDKTESFPWQILPFWIERPETLMKTNDTIFKISFKNIESFQRIKNELLEQINIRIILFLRNINKIEISIDNVNYKRLISKEIVETKKNYVIYRITEEIIEDGTEIKNKVYWLIFRETYEVEAEVKKDDMTIDWERDVVNKWEVIIAFNLIKKEKEYHLNEIESGTAHIGVYSFLPIKEVSSGLNFVVQADFLTNPGRTDLARDCKWNEWLAKCIYNTIINNCISEFLNHIEWKYEYIDTLYAYAGGHPIFENWIKMPLREYLEKEKVVISEKGEVITINDSIYIESELRKHINTNDLNLILPNKTPIHYKSRVKDLSIENSFVFNASSGASEKLNELLERKANKKNIEFFEYFYKNNVLPYRNNSSSTISRLRNKHILLTVGYKLVNSNDAKLNLNQIKIPNKIIKELNIIHSKIIKNQDIKDFFIEILKIDVLSEKDIERIMKGKEIPELKIKWPKMNENQRTKTIYYYKSLFDEGKLDNDSINTIASFIEIKSKNGNFMI